MRVFPLYVTESIFHERNTGADWSDIKDRKHPVLDDTLVVNKLFTLDSVINDTAKKWEAVDKIVDYMHKIKETGLFTFDEKAFTSYHKVREEKSIVDMIKEGRIGRTSVHAWFQSKIMEWSRFVTWKPEVHSYIFGGWGAGRNFSDELKKEVDVVWCKVAKFIDEFDGLYDFHEMLAMFGSEGSTDQEYTLKISPHGPDFMHLSMNGFDHSCYRPGSDFGHAPVVLALNKYPVVLYLFNPNGEVVARAWGILKSSGFLLCNVYTTNKRTRLFFTDLIKETMQDTYGFDKEGRLHEDEFSYDYEEVYVNRDNDYNVGPVYYKTSMPSFELENTGIIGGMWCECCERNMLEDGFRDTEDGYYCEICVDEYYVWSDYQGKYIHRDTAVEYHTWSTRFNGPIHQDYVNGECVPLIEYDGDMYLEDDMYYCEEADEWFPTQRHVDEWLEENLEEEEE